MKIIFYKTEDEKGLKNSFNNSGVVIEGMRALDFRLDDLKFMTAAYIVRRNNGRIVKRCSEYGSTNHQGLPQEISPWFNSSGSCLPLLVTDYTPFRVRTHWLCLARAPVNIYDL